MALDLELSPKQERPPGEPCCEPVVYPEVERREAERMAQVAKAIADPIRLQLVDVLRRHAGKVCVCELTPLFDVGQPTVSPPRRPAQGGHRRLRAPGPVGLLLRPPRCPRGAGSLALGLTPANRGGRRRGGGRLTLPPMLSP